MTTTTPVPETEETTQPEQLGLRELTEESEQREQLEQSEQLEESELTEQLEESEQPEESEESETTEQSVQTDALTHVLGSGLFYQDLDSLKVSDEDSKKLAPKSEDVFKNKYSSQDLYKFVDAPEKVTSDSQAQKY